MAQKAEEKKQRNKLNAQQEIAALKKRLKALEQVVEGLINVVGVNREHVTSSMNNNATNDAHGAQIPSTGINMNEQDKIQSIVNAINILPPNRVEKETNMFPLEDIAAITGIKDITFAQRKQAYDIIKATGRSG